MVLGLVVAALLAQSSGEKINDQYRMNEPAAAACLSDRARTATYQLMDDMLATQQVIIEFTRTDDDRPGERGIARYAVDSLGKVADLLLHLANLIDVTSASKERNVRALGLTRMGQVLGLLRLNSDRQRQNLREDVAHTSKPVLADRLMEAIAEFDRLEALLKGCTAK